MAEQEELTDREKVEGLRMLVIVEHATASALKRDNPAFAREDYVGARMASYELVLDAIERRWPDLEGDWREQSDELASKMVG